MPELPEVETVRQGLLPVMMGQVISGVEVRRHNLRYDFGKDFVSRLTGQRIVSLERRGKYLLAQLGSHETLLMHLGMSGSFRIEGSEPEGVFHMPRSQAQAHDHVCFVMQGGARILYNDPRRFGFMEILSPYQPSLHLQGLGPEPLDPELTPEHLHRALENRKTSLKAALLDQRIMAGLGNIYVCEALFDARLSPVMSTNCLVPEQTKTLLSSIRTVLEKAIRAGGSSISDHACPSGEMGYFQHQFQVYDRTGQPCLTPECDGKIMRMVQNGRSTFYCPHCQHGAAT